ncbi:MAG: BON domain-containing protein [Fimbriiglobus sp.]
MTVRKIRPLAVALGLWAGGTSVAQQPPAPTAQKANQQLADAVAARLTTLPAAQMGDVNIACANGVVTLTGATTDASQKASILEAVRVVPGVKPVRDGLRVAPAGGVVPVNGTVVPNGIVFAQGQGDAAALPGGPAVTPMPSGMIPGMGGPVIEPAPLGAAGMAGAPGDAPPLPPYAWPTYAPHNNVSRVAYPQAYPYNAFPYIGPFYPFPKVPLGWRSVKLEWEDGHWWMGRTSTPHDYWRVRFW